jgi:hypothetical protein
LWRGPESLPLEPPVLGQLGQGQPWRQRGGAEGQYRPGEKSPPFLVLSSHFFTLPCGKSFDVKCVLRNASMCFAGAVRLNPESQKAGSSNQADL